MNKDCLYAYFAGAIDADGYVSIEKSVKKNKSMATHRYFTPKVGFTSTSDSTVEHLLQEHFGGRVYTYKPKNPKYKAWSVWKISNRQTRNVLVTLLPYFLAKRKQAELVLEFVDVCDRQWQEIRRTQKPPYHFPADMLALREHYWEQVAALNSRHIDQADHLNVADPHPPHSAVE